MYGTGHLFHKLVCGVQFSILFVERYQSPVLPGLRSAPALEVVGGGAVRAVDIVLDLCCALENIMLRLCRWCWWPQVPMTGTRQRQSTRWTSGSTKPSPSCLTCVYCHFLEPSSPLRKRVGGCQVRLAPEGSACVEESIRHVCILFQTLTSGMRHQFSVEFICSELLWCSPSSHLSEPAGVHLTPSFVYCQSGRATHRLTHIIICLYNSTHTLLCTGTEIETKL